jgi:hypothetical protein
MSENHPALVQCLVVSNASCTTIASAWSRVLNDTISAEEKTQSRSFILVISQR